MKIDDDIEIVLGSPVYRPVQVLALALNIWFTTRNVICPIANGNPDEIEAINDELCFEK